MIRRNNTGEPPAESAGSPFDVNIQQTPIRNNNGNGNNNEAPLLHRTNAMRNDAPQQLPQPLRLFEDDIDEVATEIADDEEFDAFFNENGEIRVAAAARPTEPTTNQRSLTQTGFGKKHMISQEKFIKKYIKLGHSRQRAVAKYHKARKMY